MARKDAGRPHTARPSKWMLAGVAATVIALAFAARHLTGGAEAEAQPPATRAASAPTAPAKPKPPEHDVMALVNGQDISREVLARACVERFGEEVLEALVNKRLIEHHCRNRGVQVTRAEIEAEIDQMAKWAKIDRELWLSMLERERGVKPEEYRRDILWPTLALRKLAGSEIQVSEEELRRAYESRFGPAVRVRLIVVSNGERAQQLQRQLAERPEDFARVAMQESEDVNSASIGGMIQPIRLHTGDPLLEQAAFALEPDQVSAVIQVGQQFALLKCEGHVPPRIASIEEVRAELEKGIREEKLRGVANKLFAQLQNSATVQNVYNDPQLRQAMPGVVATVNGEQITMRELGRECLARHGEMVLEGEVSRLLLRQQLKRANLTVTQQDLQSEIAHAAELGGVTTPDGKPDLRAWVDMVTKEQDVSYEVYVSDSVWPSAALKKLAGANVVVTPEDLQKGFEANYGERVRCRAIVLGKMRRAQEVWAKAREDGSLEYFCKLAAEYSIEPSSRTLRGEVPPIRRHGGQPQLERAAFALQPGELSGIVQVGDKFVILRCEGRTEPEAIELADVRGILEQDIYEKKLRQAMAARFEQIRKVARIDNYLAGTSQAPAAKTAGGPRRDGAVRQASGVR